MELKIGDGLVDRGNLDVYLLEPPRIGTGVWTVIDRCKEHAECWLVKCSVYERHTSKEDFILVYREGDRELATAIHEKKLSMIAEELVKLLGKNPEDIQRVANLALAGTKSGSPKA
jgi:hypothetical protein